MNHRTAGFTLIELLVTMTVAAILLVVAVPSFQNMMLSSRLDTSANAVANALTLARSEAVKRNQEVNFNSDAAIENADNSATFAAAPTIPPGVQKVTGEALVATPSGFLRLASASAGYSGLVMDLYAADLPSNQHRCVYLVTGITPVVCSVNDTGTGKCPNAQPNPCQR
ncbi:GspH/FimT family pseudopilin [Thiomonas bhubaneswarensis]|uniref:Type II secretion system protein H n=1 Tax=Thiomonas bhubaneswarensis TaxID=339866 RepID=A0A0K6HW51_9BURK|nr:GspH/FimT family pseudopilin [Thiomonas bhubaneswarensis]CUA95100.1 prepilin-type N-terminal cleavage/methylation domain [Thiomonas bhubaneswarensis]